MIPRDSELFKYLTDKDNYRYVKQIESLVPEVDRILRNEFWTELVVNELQLLAKEHNPNYLLLDLKEEAKYSQILLFRQDWKDLCFTFESTNGFASTSERVFFTISINWKHYDIEAVKNIVGSDGSGLKHLSYIKRYLCWEYINYNFKKTEDMMKILPDNRDILAKEIALLLWNFANKYCGLCEKISGCLKT